jgi:hypothetical protein
MVEEYLSKKVIFKQRLEIKIRNEPKEFLNGCHFR